MARPKRITPEPEYRLLAIGVDTFDARTGAGINIDLLASRPYFMDDEEAVFAFESLLTLSGTCTYPADRAGGRYEITLVGDTPPSRKLDLRIKHLHQHDENGRPRYRKFRDHTTPIYDPPPPLGYLTKVRGANQWTSWVTVAPQVVSDSLLLLLGSRRIYLGLDEVKAQRKRWLRGLSVQTTDPAES